MDCVGPGLNKACTHVQAVIAPVSLTWLPVDDMFAWFRVRIIPYTPSSVYIDGPGNSPQQQQLVDEMTMVARYGFACHFMKGRFSLASKSSPQPPGAIMCGKVKESRTLTIHTQTNESRMTAVAGVEGSLQLRCSLPASLRRQSVKVRRIVTGGDDADV